MHNNVSNKSIKKNAVMGGINRFVSLIFPLVSFTYVSRVLGVVNYGKYNFSQSIFSYFALIAELGITTYAIREGIKYRNNKEAMSCFVSEIFTISFFMTMVSYISLGVLLIAANSLKPYRLCIMICSIAMAFTAIGVEWLFSIYEEYTYITVRNIVFKLISLVLMILLVKKQDDYLLYAFICVFASSGSCVLNYIKAHSYCKIKLKFNNNLVKHFKPVLIFAAINIAVYIYNSSDITMLGLLANDEAVGLYSAASKMYRIAKSTILAILTVTIPRLSIYVSENKKDSFDALLRKVINYMNLLMIPIVAIIIIEGKDILLIIAGEEYMGAYYTLVVLALAIVCSMYAWISSQCILVPNGHEKENLYSTILGAMINIVLNALFIPKYGSIAAAGTTVIAELFVAIYCTIKAKKMAKYRFIDRNMVFIILASIFMFLVGVFLSNIISNLYIRFLVVGILTMFIYMIVVIITKNDYAKELIEGFVRVVGKRK